MENGQKAIIIGVGLFLTILIVSIVLFVTNSGIMITTNASDKAGDINESLQKQLTTQYDQMILTGQDVVMAINIYNEKLNNNIIVYNNLEIKATTSDAWKVHNNTDTKTIDSVLFPVPFYVKCAENASEFCTVAYNDSGTKVFSFWKYYEENTMSVSNNSELISKIDLESKYKSVLLKEIFGDNDLGICGIVFLLI